MYGASDSASSFSSGKSRMNFLLSLFLSGGTETTARPPATAACACSALPEKQCSMHFRLKLPRMSSTIASASRECTTTGKPSLSASTSCDMKHSCCRNFSSSVFAQW